MVDVALAFLAGVFTAAAPCILPMLPIVFGTSLAGTSRARPAFIALGFTTAFSAVGLAFGVFTDVLGLSPTALRAGASFLLLVFGLLMIWPGPFERFAARLGGIARGADRVGAGFGSGNAGGFVLGMSLGVVWTPCAGPVLGSILTLVATAEHLRWAALLLVSYAAGAGLPMLAVAYGGQMVSSRLRLVARHSQRLQQAFGVVVILVAVAIFCQYDTLITVWLADFYPGSRPGL